jgi:hypothetical protein
MPPSGREVAAKPSEGDRVPVSLSRFILWIWFIYSGTPSAEYQIYRDAVSLSHLR